MNRFLFTPILLASFVAVAAGQDQGPVKLSLSANRSPVPVLRFALLPELRDQTPGNAAPLYRKAAGMLAKVPVSGKELAGLQTVTEKWEVMAVDQLPRDEVRKVLALYKETLEQLEKATRCEYCDWELAQRVRESGINTILKDIQDMRPLSQVLCLQARLDLADNRPDRALHALRCNFAMSRHIAECPTLICQLVAIALLAKGNSVMEQVIAHPETPNLYWSLASLPQPFIDSHRSFEGEKLGIYATFPGALEVANNPDAGPMTAEQIEKIVKTALTIEGIQTNSFAQRLILAQKVRNQHQIAKKALIAAGRPAEQVEKWPHMQVALMHSLGECEQLLDELIKWQNVPYWQAEGALEQLEKRFRATRTRGPNDPALALAPMLLPATQKLVLARFRLERQLAALRCLEGIRLYAAEHRGQLPSSLPEIDSVPIPNCPVTGKPFAYQRTGDTTAVLKAPLAPRISFGIPALSYELTLRR